jgi:hypothetical protein
MIITTYTSPLEKRPIWQSLISGMFGIASVIAPLVRLPPRYFENVVAHARRRLGGSSPTTSLGVGVFTSTCRLGWRPLSHMMMLLR